MLFRNTAAQSATRMSGYLFSLIIAPIMLARLGLDQFGIWAVTGTIATYAGLLDFGISRSLSRFVALYDARGDRKAIEECLGLGILAVTVLALALVVIATAAAAPLAQLFGTIDAGEMRIVLLCATGIFVSHAYRSVLISVPVGLRQMVPPNVAGVFGNVLNFSFSLAALLIAPTLVNYAVANVVADFLALIPAWLSLIHVWKPVRLALPSRARRREILGYGIKSQANTVADLINLQTDKVIIAVIVDVRAAATYEIAARVVAAVKAIGGLTISAMIPTATVHLAEHGRGAIAAFYQRYTLFTSALAFPIFTLSCITAPILLIAWLGNIPGDADVVLIVLAAANSVNVTTGVAMTVALGDGRAGMVGFNSALTALLNVLFTLALAPLFGLWGVLVGTALAFVVGGLIFLRKFHGVYSIPARDFLSGVGPPAAVAVGLAVPFMVVSLLLVGPLDTRLPATVALVSSTVLYLGAYWLAASHFGLLPARLARRRRGPHTPAEGVAGASAD